MSSPSPEPRSGPPPGGPPGHPLAGFAPALVSRLGQLTGPAARPVWGLSPSEARQVVVALTTARSMIDALRLQVLAEVDRGDANGAETSAAEWVAAETRQRRTAARADLKLARALGGHHRVEAGMAAGVVNADQAGVIVRALDRLPATGEFAVDAVQRDAAEVHLVKLAAVHDAQALEVLGRRVFEVIAPDLAEAYEGKLLEAHEAAAARKTSLTMHETPDGLVCGRFAIPVLHGAILQKAIGTLASPVGSDEAVIDTSLPSPVRNGIAFTQLLEVLPAGNLPTVGGGDITVVVTMRHDQLLADLDKAGIATLDTGHAISAGEARRLACGQRLVPAVLDGASVALDLGRSRRLHTKAQRLALAQRDGGCTAVGCDRPPAWCQAHHDVAWADGGTTDVTNGRLLCGHHHRRIHDPAFHHETRADGTVQFVRRE